MGRGVKLTHGSLMKARSYRDFDLQGRKPLSISQTKNRDLCEYVGNDRDHLRGAPEYTAEATTTLAKESPMKVQRATRTPELIPHASGGSTQQWHIQREELARLYLNHQWKSSRCVEGRRVISAINLLTGLERYKR